MFGRDLSCCFIMSSVPKYEDVFELYGAWILFCILLPSSSGPTLSLDSALSWSNDVLLGSLLSLSIPKLWEANLLIRLNLVPTVTPVFRSISSSRSAWVPRSAYLIGSSSRKRARVMVAPIPVTTRTEFLHPKASLMKEVILANPTPILIAAT